MATLLSAIRCEQRDRVAFYQTAAPVSEVVSDLLAGNDPRPQHWSTLPPHVRDMYIKLQRKAGKQRRDDIKRYIVDRMSPKATWIGGFPGIVVGMPLKQDFTPLATQDYEDMGTLRLKRDLQRPNILLDGLGRFTGLLDTAEDETLPTEIREWAANYRVPILIVSATEGQILGHDELGQLFHDFNILATPIGKGQALDLDHSDLYGLTTNRVGALDIIEQNGGFDARAVTIREGVWTTKTILLKSVRAAAEGPGSHVDHIREQIADPWLHGADRQQELVDRFEDSLCTFVDALPEPIAEDGTLIRTATWWVAFGLMLHDLYKSYEGATISDEQREVFLRRLGAIDWGLGNPELSFLGSSVQVKDRKTKEFQPLPLDDQGRPMINRFHGGSKSYFNLAAFMRRKIGLHDVVEYGPDYGTSVQFDNNGAVISTAEPLTTEAVTTELVHDEA